MAPLRSSWSARPRPDSVVVDLDPIFEQFPDSRLLDHLGNLLKHSLHGDAVRAYSGDSHRQQIPGVLVVHFGDRHLEAIPDLVPKHLPRAALLFEGSAAVQANTQA